jgi:cell wall-associated NlpC family hydrolase
MHAPNRVRTHVRRRIGVAVVAVATAVVTAPFAKAAPARDPVDTIVPKKTSRRHWGRYSWYGGWHALPAHHPSIVEIVLATARAQLGKPYVWGAAGPRTFDCSGLTKFVYAAAGIALPHNAAAQYASIKHIPLKSIRPGDLVFSGYGGVGHVGIYIGGGRMIHAPHTGARVEVAALHSNTIGAGRPGRS